MVLINYYFTLVHVKYESFQILKNVVKGLGLAQAVSCWHFKAEVETRYHASLCGTFGGKRTITTNCILCSSSSPVITVLVLIHYTLSTLPSPVSTLPMPMPYTLCNLTSPVSILPILMPYTLSNLPSPVSILLMLMPCTLSISSSAVITIPDLMPSTLSSLPSPVSILPILMPYTLSTLTSPVNILHTLMRFTLSISSSPVITAHKPMPYNLSTCLLLLISYPYSCLILSAFRILLSVQFLCSRAIISPLPSPVSIVLSLVPYTLNSSSSVGFLLIRTLYSDILITHY